MDKNTAQISIKNLYGEVFSLTPSALITFFEIDISNLIFDQGLLTDLNRDNENQRIFRFHNNVSLLNKDLIWQGYTYMAAPITADGFELNSRGTLPVPKLAITSSDEGIPLLSTLKSQINRLGDLAGAKVTRIRTLMKFLDKENFENAINPTEDKNAEFPRDVFYIDRKSNENKTGIEYELSSILDIEGVKLPARLVVANRCVWSYRGEGCMYERSANRVESIHGSASHSILPNDAPPVANEKNEKIADLLPGVNLVYKGKWQRGKVFNIGDYIYVEKDGLKYYFVAKITVPSDTSPPNANYWIADLCGKQISSCKIRWGLGSPGQNPLIGGNPNHGCLNFGGFPATSKVR